MRRRLPNAITLLRLLALPFFAWAVIQGRARLATGLLLALASSDALDGFLARRWRVESRLGALLDPVVDKLTQVTGLVLLATTGHASFTRIPPLFVAIVLARDLLLAYGAFRIRARRGAVTIRPRLEGKLSTAVVFLLLLAACVGAPPWIVNVLAAVAAPVVVAAGARYVHDGWKQEAVG